MGGIGAFFFVAAVGAVIAVARSASSHQRVNTEWQEAASRLGILLRPGKGLGRHPSMEGQVREMLVKIDIVSRNDTTYTRYRVRFPKLLLGLELQKEGFINRVGRLLGMQDIDVGDAIFDREVVVRGDVPAQVREFLTPARRLAIRALFEAHPEARIHDGEIVVMTRGFERNAERLVAVLNRLLSTGSSLAGTDPVQEEVAIKRAAGELSEAIDTLRARRSETVDPWEEYARRQAEIEMLYVDGAPEAAEKADTLQREVPEDPVYRRLSSARKQPVRPDPPPAPVAPEPVPSQPSDPIDEPPSKPDSPTGPPLGRTAQEAAEHLFHPDNYSFDTNEIFAAEYEGRSVDWTGVLVRSRTFERDRELGPGPGVKAVLRLFEVDRGLYQGQSVDAIVGLPADTQLEVGSEYRIRGLLVGCDAVVRNLYVANGTVVEG